jgi:ribosomal protein S18 acetylase RimI-like enzyme
MASDGINVVVSPEDIGLAARILARAFHTDPPFEYFIPDPVRRAQVLPQFFARFVRHGQLFGEVHTTPQPSEAVAIWLPPGSTDITPDQERRSGLDELPEVLGEDSFARLSTFLARMHDLHHAAMAGDHWYLFFIGVEPECQGRGIGGALLGPMLARAGHELIPCYLETFLARNVPFYQRHGFKVVVEGTLPESGLAFWTMRREP